MLSRNLPRVAGKYPSIGINSGRLIVGCRPAENAACSFSTLNITDKTDNDLLKTSLTTNDSSKSARFVLPNGLGSILVRNSGGAVSFQRSFTGISSAAATGLAFNGGPSVRHLSTAQHLEKLGIKISELGSLPDIPTISSSSVLDKALEYATHGNIYEVGLGKWYTTSGWYQRMLDFMVNSCDIPWWASIIMVTIVIRISLAPVTIMMQKHAARAHNAHPGFVKASKRMSDAQASGDRLNQLDAYTDLTDYIKKHDISPMKRLPGIGAQFCVFMTVFWGLRNMVTYNVDGLSTGGILWFHDLTVPDALYTINFYGANINVPGALPMVSAATLMLVTRLGVESGMSVDAMSPFMRKMFLYGLPLSVYGLTGQYASVMSLYWCVSNGCSLAFAGFFKLQSVRDMLKIPRRIEHPPHLMHMPSRSPLSGNTKTRSLEELQQSHVANLRKSAESTTPVITKYTIKSARQRKKL